MVEGVEEDEEIEVNAKRNGPNGDQMGQVLALMRIMQKRVSEVDRKLFEKINPKKSSDGENPDLK